MQRIYGPRRMRRVLDSGITGLTPSKLDDVKCLHAQLADELLSRDNDVGKAGLDGLAARGERLRRQRGREGLRRQREGEAEWRRQRAGGGRRRGVPLPTRAGARAGYHEASRG